MPLMTRDQSIDEKLIELSNKIDDMIISNESKFKELVIKIKQINK